MAVRRAKSKSMQVPLFHDTMVTYDFNADSRAIHQGASRASTAYLVSTVDCTSARVFQPLPIVPSLARPSRNIETHAKERETGDQGSIYSHLIVPMPDECVYK